MTGKVLVTGSRGFIGSHLCKKLDASKIPYVAFEGDLNLFENVISHFQTNDVDTVYHLAGMSNPSDCDKNPSLAFQTNVVGTIHLLEAIHRINKKVKFIFPSTSHVYSAGANESEKTLIDEDSDLSPASVYAKTKRICEQAIETYYKSHDIGSAVVLRLFNHTHSSQTGTFFFPQILKQIKELPNSGGTIKTGDIEIERDFSLVDNLLDVLIKLHGTNIKTSFEIANACSSQPRILKELILELAKKLNKQILISSDASRARSHNPKFQVGSNNKLTKLIGSCYPKITNEEFIDKYLS